MGDWGAALRFCCRSGCIGQRTFRWPLAMVKVAPLLVHTLGATAAVGHRSTGCAGSNGELARYEALVRCSSGDIDTLGAGTESETL